MNRKINELKAGVILSYVNLAISCIIPLIYTPIMLRILGQAEYGVYSLSNSIVSYLTVLNFGMGSAVMRYVAKARAEKNQEKIDKIVGLFLLIYIVLALLVIIVGCILSGVADIFFSEGLTSDEISTLRVLIVIMSLSTAVSFPASVLSSVCGAYEKFVFRRLFDLAVTIAGPVLNVIMLVLGNGSIGLALVGLFMQVIYIPFFIRYCTKRLNVHPKFRNPEFKVLKDIWAFSAFVFFSMIVDMLYWATDKVLIGAVIGSVAVAIYNVGGTFTSMLQSMSSAISSVFVPRVTTMVVTENDPGEISKLLIKVGRIQYLVVSFILAGYITFGKIFIHFWSGDDYMNAYYVALLTMIPLTVPLIQNIAYNTILAQKKHQFRAIVYAVIAVVNVISTYLVLPKFGIIGAAVCTGLAYTLGNGVIMNIYYYKVTKLDIPSFWKNILKMSMVPAVLVIVGGLLCNQIIAVTGIIRFLIEVVIFSVIFWLATWFISMNPYERELFSGMAKKLSGKIKRNL